MLDPGPGGLREDGAEARDNQGFLGRGSKPHPWGREAGPRGWMCTKGRDNTQRPRDPQKPTETEMGGGAWVRNLRSLACELSPESGEPREVGLDVRPGLG